MKKVYLLVYNSLLGSRDKIKDWADKSSLVIYWRYDLPNCIYLVSESSADELDADLEKQFGRRGRYLLTEISDNRNGLLPSESWYLFKNKQRKPQ